MKGYLINNKIEFWPEDNLLVLHADQRVNYNLTAPASRCFLFLLLKAPEIVPQNDIYKAVWEDESILVPPNTLYQNIASIRRGLKTLSQDDNIIITIPKKGFQIPSSINIQEMTLQDAITEITASPTTQSPVRKPVLKSKISALIFSLICVLALTLVFFTLYIPDKAKNNFFASFEFVGKKNGCSFFHNSNTADINWERELTYTGIKLNCDAFPWVYMTSYKYTPSISIIGCNKPFQNKNISCVSFFFREVNENEKK
ncbi:winged helix-turn-helix domain-containing protein [Trabulsiella guamensis]|nr:winged helix-turn-helix domain-containing protein [Trabulsiella guamensis]